MTYPNLPIFSFLFLLGFNVVLMPAFATEQLKTVDFYGNWTLDKLGYSPIVFRGQNDTESYTIGYVLPQNASQGTKGWYLINLNFIIEFNENSTEGDAYISASTNNWSSAMVKFEVNRSNNNFLINWSERNLLGVSRYSTSYPKINVSFSNYIPYKGVSPGINTLTFKLEQYGGTKVKKLEILSTSGIEFAQLSPPNLKLDVNSMQFGDRYIINFTLKNTGDHPAKNVKVQPVYPTEALELIGERSYYLPYLRDRLEGNFEFRPFKKGEYEIVITTQTESGIPRPSVRIIVAVKDRKTIFPQLILLIAVASALVVYIFRKINKSQ